MTSDSGLDLTTAGEAIFYCPAIWDFLRAPHDAAALGADRRRSPWEHRHPREQDMLNQKGLSCEGHTVVVFSWSPGSYPWEHDAHAHLRRCDVCDQVLQIAAVRTKAY